METTGNGYQLTSSVQICECFIYTWGGADLEAVDMLASTQNNDFVLLIM